jgi:S1-C subfamily serine protease
LAGLYSFDVAVHGESRQGAPVALIRDVNLMARDDDTLGMRLATSEGLVVVESVRANGRAKRSGVEAGDIVVAVNGRQLQTVPDASGLTGVAGLLCDVSGAKLSLRRGGRQQNVTLRTE